MLLHRLSTDIAMGGGARAAEQQFKRTDKELIDGAIAPIIIPSVTGAPYENHD
jgi:hypothetical protein